MTRLQFGDFLFEQNPRRIEVTYARNVVTHAVPAWGAETQDLGPRCRVVRCEGEVFAPTAEGAMAKLSTIGAACAGGGPAMLYLPTGERFSAAASRFSYAAQGDGRVLSYALEFVEWASAPGGSGL